MAVWEDKIYFSDWSTKKVHSVLKMNGTDAGVVLEDSEYHGLALYQPRIREDVSTIFFSLLHRSFIRIVFRSQAHSDV